MSSDRRWSKFWWEDYEGDPLLSACSLPAQGLWMRMLCLMHRGTPYGHLVINEKPPTTKVLASIVRTSERELVKLLKELEEYGVFSRQEDGTIFSRRMVKDAERSEEGREAVAKRWGNTGNGGNGHREPNRPPTREPKPEPKGHPNGEPIGDLLHQEARSKKEEARSKKDPPKPPVTGGRARACREDAEFAAFYANYPRKDGVDDALKAWKSVIAAGATPDEIMEGLARYKFRDDPQYIRLPAGWLRGGCWKAVTDNRDPVLVAAGFDFDAIDDDPLASLQRPELLS